MTVTDVAMIDLYMVFGKLSSAMQANGEWVLGAIGAGSQAAVEGLLKSDWAKEGLKDFETEIGEHYSSRNLKTFRCRFRPKETRA